VKLQAISIALLVAAVAAAGAAPAQQAARTVAKLTGMQGNVLVSQGDAMAAASNGQVLPVGARVVTTAGAQVVISYDKGCDVKLNENQRFTVKELGECPALIASVESLAPGSGAIGGAAATAPAVAVVASGGIVAGIGYGIYEITKSTDNNVSPSK
jgi:hypothetical protein